MSSGLYDIDYGHFYEKGYFILKKAFSIYEIENARERILGLFEHQSRHGQLIAPSGAPGLSIIRGELLNFESTRNLLLDSRITDVAHALLGNKVVYYGDSSVHYGTNNNVGSETEGWHRDCRGLNADPFEEDWEGDYPLIRFGIYFQDHAKYSGGLGLVPGSQRVQTLTEPKIHIDLETGDLVVWNQRILHVGHYRVFPYKLEKTRLAMFASFSTPSRHLENYVAWISGKGGWMGDNIIRERWEKTIITPEIEELLSTHKIDIFPPIESYGNPQDGRG